MELQRRPGVATDDVVAVASFLAQTRLFGALSFNHLMILAAGTAVYRCPEGQVIFKKGEPGDTVYVVQTGAVRIFFPVEHGRDVTLAILYPGQVFGELSLLDGKSRSATAVAAAPLAAVTMPREHFLSLLRRRPEAAIRTLAVLAERLRRTDELLGEVVNLDVPTRLARRLLELAESAGRHADQGAAVTLDLTRQDLAGLVGTTSRTVDRYLKILTDQRILQVTRSKVVVLQPDSLKALAK